MVPSAATPIGPCHFCGKLGHLRLHCPVRAAATVRKWCPFQSDCVVGVDVEHGVCKCRVDECVNCTDMKVNGSTCMHIESKEGVEGSDVDDSAMEAGVSGVRACSFCPLFICRFLEIKLLAVCLQFNRTTGKVHACVHITWCMVYTLLLFIHFHFCFSLQFALLFFCCSFFLLVFHSRSTNW